MTSDHIPDLPASDFLHTLQFSLHSYLLCAKADNSQLYKQLDAAIEKRAHYVEVKEKSLNDIKQGAKYVASDDDEVKESLKSKYPNRIITLMDDTDRNSLVIQLQLCFHIFFHNSYF